MTEHPIQKSASLHEKTVQAVAQGNVLPMPQRRGRGPQKAVQPIEQIKVHPLVWAHVQKLLSGSYSDIKIISETEVLVR